MMKMPEMDAYVIRWILLTLWILMSGFNLHRPCLAVDVLQQNLSISSSVVALDEAQTTRVTLTQINCTDSDGAPATVSIDKVTPSKACNNCFSILPCQNNFCLTFFPLETLDIMKVSTYVITVKCVTKERKTMKDYIQVRLQRDTHPPVFTSFPRVVTVDETETREVNLQRITCTDPDGTQVKVDLYLDPRKLAKNACAKCFSLEPCETKWCLKYIPGVGDLSFIGNPNYPMTLTCSDEEGLSVTSDIEVRVTKNSPPAFDKLFDAKRIVDASQVTAGTDLYHVIATDQENDTLFYTMTTSPDVPQLAIGFTDGVIRAYQDLSQVCIPKVTCQVKVSDHHNPTETLMVLDLTLEGANVAPSITNMAGVIQVPEDTAINKTIYTVAVNDQDSVNRMTLTLKAQPTQAQRFFRLDGNEIVVTSLLNYEDASMQTISLSVTATDSGGCTSQPRTLTVRVTDVNEPPRLLNSRVPVIVYEGDIDIQTDWKVEDEDYNDTKKFSIVRGNGHGRFAIDSTTGVIRSTLEYDVDRNKMPTIVNLYVQVEDKGGLISEGIVLLEILDANDNPPYIEGTSQTYSVTECTAIGTKLATLVIEDVDSHFQGNSRYSAVPVDQPPLSLVSSGDVILSAQMSAGEVVTIEAYAIDKGEYPQPLRSTSPVYLTVHCRTCPSGTTVRSATGKPATVKPAPVEPVTVKPAPVEPVTVKPVTVKPVTVKPVTVKPVTVKPVTVKPVTVAPTQPTKRPVLGVQPYNSSGLHDNLWWIAVASILGVVLLCLLAWLFWTGACCCRRDSCRRTKVTKVIPLTPMTPVTPMRSADPRRKPTPKPVPKTSTLTPVVNTTGPKTPEVYMFGNSRGHHLYEFWKERYNEEDYDHYPNRNSKPAPYRDTGSVSSSQTIRRGRTTERRKRGCVIS